MATKSPHRDFWESGKTDVLRSWIMVALILAFVLLYAAALTGWLKPFADEKMALRLEPIIFVIMGYYFGRLPAQQNEHTLKMEIGRQAQKTDATQHAKEQALQALATLEEKVKNVTAALAPAATLRKRLEERSGTYEGDETLSRSLFAALDILNS